MGLALDRTTSSFVASIITSARVLPAVSHALRKRRDRPDSAARLQLRDQPEHNSHIDAYPSGNTAVRRRRPQEQDPHRQSGSTSHREADTKPGNDTIIAESRMADAQGPPDAHSQAVFDQRLTVIWTDVDGESITASLPVEECRTWRDLCDKMGEHLISAQTYTMTHGLAVQTEEGTGTILFEGTWAQWMSSFLESSPVLSLHVVPRTLPDPCFNNASREQDPRVTCGIQLDATFPVAELRADFIVPPASTAELCSRQATPLTSTPVTIVRATSTPVVRGTQQVADPSTRVIAGVVTNSTTTASHSVPSAFAQAGSKTHRPPQLYKPIVRSLHSAMKFCRRFGQYLFRALLDIYIFTICPSFLQDENAAWDHERLDNRLSDWKSWILASNLVIVGASAAFLAIGSISSNSWPATFLILAAIFGVFGAVFSFYLASQVGDRKADFVIWFVNHPCLRREGLSAWSLSTMAALPLAWMVWALLSLLAFAGCMWLQQLDAILNSARGSQGVASDVAVSPQTVPITQLVICTVVPVWSAGYFAAMVFQLNFSFDTFAPIVTRGAAGLLSSHKALW